MAHHFSRAVSRGISLSCHQDARSHQEEAKQKSPPPSRTFNFSALSSDLFARIIEIVRQDALKRSSKQYPFKQPGCERSTKSGEKTVETLKTKFMQKHPGQPACEFKMHYILQDEKATEYTSCFFARIFPLKTSKMLKLKPCISLWPTEWNELKYQCDNSTKIQCDQYQEFLKKHWAWRRGDVSGIHSAQSGCILIDVP